MSHYAFILPCIHDHFALIPIQALRVDSHSAQRFYDPNWAYPLDPYDGPGKFTSTWGDGSGHQPRDVIGKIELEKMEEKKGSAEAAKSDDPGPGKRNKRRRLAKEDGNSLIGLLAII